VKWLTKRELLEHVWDFEFERGSQHRRGLRRSHSAQIDVASEPPMIDTIRGAGYRLSDAA